VLERLKSGQVGTQRHDAEIGLVPESSEGQDLVGVVDEPVDRIEHTLGSAGLVLGSRVVDPIEEVQDPPPRRRLNRIHGVRG
jgi:hypothetical protein